MNTFYFNTGVKPSANFAFDYHQKVGNVIRGGVLQCPFDCDAPSNSVLMFLCDSPNLDEGKVVNVIVREIHNTSLLSLYAYMRVVE